MTQQMSRDRAIQQAKEIAEEDVAKAEGREPSSVQDLLEDNDALLDEIDSILEDQQHLAAFRQRGGQ